MNAVHPGISAPPPLYADRRRVYPKAVAGRVRTVKWFVLSACLALYYLVPWIRWDRGPGMPDQAVLVDLRDARLFLFWIEIWPQEIYYLTGLLILAAMALFFVSALFGRVWCGFACPQTVWTDLFMWVERQFQGDRNERMRLDQAPWTPGKFRKKALTHVVWIAIAAGTGGAWVMYFNDAPTLAMDLVDGRAGPDVYFFFGLFTGTTYLLGGIAREQVCTYMCPWPRFQAAMLDEDSLTVSYRAWRGEPRGKPRSCNVGDCIDCRACINVCPTGIDIRDGQQIECIGCGLCIDACDDIMRRLSRPEGLIAFESITNLGASGAAVAGMGLDALRIPVGMAVRKPLRLLRLRTLVYAGMLCAVSVTMLGAWALRETVTLTALRDRAPLFVRMSDGGLRNGYTLKLVNRGHEVTAFTLDFTGPAELRISVSGAATDAAGHPILSTRPDGVTQWHVFITSAGGAGLPGSIPIVFRLFDPAGHEVAQERSVFLGPGT